MESKVIFQDKMDLQSSDFNTLQDYAQRSLDHIVGDGITAQRKFAGFDTSQTSSTAISVAPGRIYQNGVVSVRQDAFTADFVANLPGATKRIVTIAAFASEIDTTQTQREFLIDEATNQSQGKVVAIEHARLANINSVVGLESPDPLPPLLDGAVMAIANITLTPAGIESVEMVAENKLDSVDSVSTRVAGLEQFRDVTSPQVGSLSSDIASLKVGTQNNVSREVYSRALARLAVLEAKDGIPSTAADSSADFFLDDSQSDLDFSGSNCTVAEGIRFAPNAIQDSQLQVVNPLDTSVSITGGLLLPAFTATPVLTSGAKSADLLLSSFSYTENQLVLRTIARERERLGPEFTVCTNSAWWQTGQYNYDQQTFAKDGEVFQVDGIIAGGYGAPGHDAVRLQEYFYDTVEETYWANVSVPMTVPGMQVAQTFLNSSDRWLVAIGLTFTRLAADGAVTVALAEVTNGLPDLSAVIASTTLQRAALTQNAETKVALTPTFLEAGKRYAIVVITAAAHYIATTTGANFPGGTLFYVLDGAYQQGDATKDLAFTLYAAKFAASRTVVQLQPLQLAGGIAAIDILADSMVPQSCQKSYAVQINGDWITLSASTAGQVLGAGGAMPPYLPFRVELTGTQDVMPAVVLPTSRVRVSRPNTALRHISVPFTPPAPTSSIHVTVRFEAWEAAHHTATVALLTGADWGTVATANSFADVTNDDGTVERTYLFTLGAAVPAYRIRIDATTDSALNTFHFGWRKNYNQ